MIEAATGDILTADAEALVNAAHRRTFTAMRGVRALLFELKNPAAAEGDRLLK